MSPSFEALFTPGCLPDERLRKRAIKIGEAAVERPGAAMTEAFEDWADTRAAYEFFDNERLSLQVVLAGPMAVVGRALGELAEGTTVLNVQDTSEINLSHLQSMSGLGEIGNPKNRGLFLHPSLALTTAGVPLGLLTTQTWVRPPDKHGKTKKRRAKSFEDKESLRWWTAIEEAEQRVDRPGLLVHVSDRESDIYEVFERATTASYRLLVRAAQDRRVEGEQHTLWAQAETFAPSRKHQKVSVPSRPAKDGKPARAEREAMVNIRYGAVSLCAPHRATGALEMWAILVREVDPPKGVEPVEWLLLTLDPITSFAAAWMRVEWYRCRWRIEEFFRVLKSGCRIEARQFESRDTFEVSLAISMLTAVRLLGFVKQAQVDPDAPASLVLTADEEHLLAEKAEKLGRPAAPGPLRLADAVLLIAMMGGYKARKCDGPPGWITLWRGYRHLCSMLEGYRLARNEPRAHAAGRTRGGKSRAN
jgi:hypothetical protein